jgi:hypothetical protein
MTAAQLRLRGFLETVSDVAPLPPGLHYRLMWDFVLRHGTWYEPRPYPANLREGLIKYCFGNSILLSAAHGFRYVEGFALLPPPYSAGVPIHHAWNVDAFGALIDSTWNNEGIAYLGVEFSLERADDATWNGDASVLNDHKRGFPLFREPWTGEDWKREWPASDRLVRKIEEALQAMNAELAG